MFCLVTLLQTVVFCLVDIYILLGKAFLPYLEGLNSTQLRLVTIYANRISQARTGAAIDNTQWTDSHMSAPTNGKKIKAFWVVARCSDRLLSASILYIVRMHHLQLVTIYANWISHSRTGAAIDNTHWPDSPMSVPTSGKKKKRLLSSVSAFWSAFLCSDSVYCVNA